VLIVDPAESRFGQRHVFSGPGRLPVHQDLHEAANMSDEMAAHSEAVARERGTPRSGGLLRELNCRFVTLALSQRA
jgi:hypothetical protein